MPVRLALGLAAATLVAAAMLLGGTTPRGPLSTSAEPSPPMERVEMVEVPGGAFVRGCNRDAIGALGAVCEDDPEAFTALNTPTRSIELPTFWIDRHEVTRSAYAECVAAGVCTAGRVSPPSVVPASEQGLLPVTGVTWSDADTYCRWRDKRLPTESEWEKAARGTDGRIMPWGNALPDCGTANVMVMGQRCDDQPGHPTAVTRYLGDVSPYGVLGMAGNVQEWVADWRIRDAYAQDEVTQFVDDRFVPEGPRPRRVVRGGHYRSPLPGLTLPVRRGVMPEHHLPHLGFRCASDEARQAARRRRSPSTTSAPDAPWHARFSGSRL